MPLPVPTWFAWRSRCRCRRGLLKVPECWLAPFLDYNCKTLTNQFGYKNKYEILEWLYCFLCCCVALSKVIAYECFESL